MPTRPIKSVPVANIAVVSSGTPQSLTQAISTKQNQGFPTGDQVLHRLNMRISGNLNLVGAGPAGAVNVRGGLLYGVGLWVQTPQHGVLINGLDLLSLHNILFMRNQFRPVNVDISSAGNGTPTFDYHLSIPFRDHLAQRPEDCGLDMYKVSYMEVLLNWGVQAGGGFINGGTYTTEQVQVLTVEMSADVDPGPVDTGSLPVWKPYLDILRFPVNQTTTGQQILLPYGGRLIRNYYIQQRNGTTLLELANTIIGVNDQDRLTFAVGGYPWIYRKEWLELQDQNAEQFKISANPTGMGVLSFAPRDADGYYAAEMMGLNANSGATPLVEIDVDVTSVTNGQLFILTEAQTPIPVDAQRPKATTSA